MTLKTLDNSLQLLKYFTQNTPSWGVRELAKEAGINHSIVYRILSTFENHGFLIQDPETKKYELGLRFLEYGNIVSEKMKLSEFIYPIMKRLSDQINESIFLTWLDDYEGVTVEIAESNQKIKFAVSLGTRTPLYAGASCKLIMAYLPREKQLEIIKRGMHSFTDKTIIDEENLLKDLDKIKSQGYCYSIGEYSDSVFGLGVPLFRKKDEIIASLTISGPEYRMTEADVPKTLAILQKEAENIQKYLYQSSFYK